ncbi:two-component sensor histidine kinase [Vallitalea longa]|uniref:histidine kinase n=1 Tax=Vallitalea longa TaxID=2936439 RepID=A0A9W5YCB7_9FIRM|nr:HAMP domain-containing sensor histidine kinase [Vallitalea longa]GKX29723.1 two-component sensor histidine kinase [Vallitalea longa]
MKQHRVNLKSGTLWLLLLLISNLFFAFVMWLIAPEAFGSIIVMIVLFTIIIIIVGYWINHKKQKKQMEALQSFFTSPDEESKQILLATFDNFWHPIIQCASTQMREQVEIIKDKQLELQNYQEFIEAWTHEIKTPLSLATLVLDNHKDDMSPYVYKRMEHVRYVINSDIEKILYYARLHADHVDYRFKKIILTDCVNECLEDFRGIIDEKDVNLQLNLIPLQIVNDKKVLIFMISQILSNAFKYTPSEKAVINITSWRDTQDNSRIHLAIRDNGRGVPPEDMPFLLDKGFTGNHPDRQNATGMGLYFVKKYGDALSIEVNIRSVSTDCKGFEIELIFPEVV